MVVVRSVAALVFLTITLSASAFSWDDDSHYVSLGPRNGYYIVTPDSNLIRQLGLYEAPVIDTADPLRHGYGADALAFRFNRNGVLIAPPAYIVQGLPYDFYTHRIGSLTRGRESRGWFYVVLRVASLQSIRGPRWPSVKRTRMLDDRARCR
jgi:hypothetical protein